MANQYLIPGEDFLDESGTGTDYLDPGLAFLNEPSVSVTLTLVATTAAGAGGSVTPGVSFTFSATSGAGAASALTVGTSLTVAAAMANGDIGSLVVEVAVPLVGVAGAGAPGSLGASADTSFALTGVSAAGVVVLRPAPAYLIPGADWFDDGTPGQFLDPGSLWLNALGTEPASAIIPEIDVTPAGVSVAGEAGTFGSITLSGVTAEGDPGSLALSITVALSAVSGTGVAAGTTPEISLRPGAAVATSAVSQFIFPGDDNVGLVGTTSTGAARPFGIATDQAIALDSAVAAAAAGNFRAAENPHAPREVLTPQPALTTILGVTRFETLKPLRSRVIFSPARAAILLTPRPARVVVDPSLIGARP